MNRRGCCYNNNQALHYYATNARIKSRNVLHIRAFVALKKYSKSLNSNPY